MGGYVKIAELTQEQKAARYAQQQAWIAANPERRRAIQKRCDDKRKESHYAQNKVYRDTNPELIREVRKKSREKHGDADRARTNAWCEANKEYRKEWRRQYDAENRQQVREMKRKWNDANHDKILEQRRVYREKNRKHLVQQFRNWFKKNEESFAELKQGKAPRRAAILQKWQLCGELCYICGLHLDRVGMEMDHVIPRAVGGTNDIENLMPTHQTCNRRKNKRLDYPIARADLVALATVIKATQRVIRKPLQLPEDA